MTETEWAAAIATGVSVGVVTALKLASTAWQRIQVARNGRTPTVPCPLHAGMETMLTRLLSDQRVDEQHAVEARQLSVVVSGEHGERIAVLEATASSTQNGIREIKVSLRDIENLLRNSGKV